MTRKYGRVDTNQRRIVLALRQVGASVATLSDAGAGVPDLLVGYRGLTLLMEVKDGSKPPSQRKLTKDQEQWHGRWRGGPCLVVISAEDALMQAQTAWRKRC